MKILQRGCNMNIISFLSYILLIIYVPAGERRHSCSAYHYCILLSYIIIVYYLVISLSLHPCYDICTRWRQAAQVQSVSVSYDITQQYILLHCQPLVCVAYCTRCTQCIQYIVLQCQPLVCVAQCTPHAHNVSSISCCMVSHQYMSHTAHSMHTIHHQYVSHSAHRMHTMYLAYLVVASIAIRICRILHTACTQFIISIRDLEESSKVLTRRRVLGIDGKRLRVLVSCPLPVCESVCRQ